MSELKPCPVTQIQAYRAYEKLLEIMEDETDDQTEAFSAAYKALYWIANDYCAQPAACEIAEYIEDCKDRGFCTQLANEPLTPEQLREMDGEPVFVASPGAEEYGHWGIVCGIDDTAGRTLYLRGDYSCHDYGKTWLVS